MKSPIRTLLPALLALALCGCGTAPSAPDGHLSDYVSTLVGTESDWTFSTGNTYPAIALPWGMNFWTPMTSQREQDGWAYQYGAHRITGFKQTHQPSPWINDYGAFSVMPFTGTADGKPASWFSHKSEVAKPYYYRVYLADYDITVEITPTERAAVMRFTFPDSDSARIAVNPYRDGLVNANGREATGFSVQNHGGVPEGFRNYFVIRSDAPLLEAFPTTRGQ
ncbi:MAG: glycoside hydrolase family 92 protein, partial [Bacteroidales bacterium]|nr:glycoside hydrolase family 92 protein [Bacteroidales bacterium]